MERKPYIRTKPIAKTTYPNHIIADLSVNHVERFVLRCGYTLERTVHDYGVDLLEFKANVRRQIRGVIHHGE